jgi:hypothetical protein
MKLCLWFTALQISELNLRAVDEGAGEGRGRGGGGGDGNLASGCAMYRALKGKQRLSKS